MEIALFSSAINKKVQSTSVCFQTSPPIKTLKLCQTWKCQKPQCLVFARILLDFWPSPGGGGGVGGAEGEDCLHRSILRCCLHLLQHLQMKATFPLPSPSPYICLSYFILCFLLLLLLLLVPDLYIERERPAPPLSPRPLLNSRSKLQYF